MPRNIITSPDITQREIDHMNIARQLAGECMVLLENDGALPIAKGSRVALYGNGARSTVKGGTGSGDVNTRSNVNIEQGLKQAGFEVASTGWLDRYDDAIRTAKEAHQKMVEENVREHGSSFIMEAFMNPFREPAVIPVTKEDVEEAACDTAIYVIARNSGEGADRWAKPGDYYLSPEDKIALAALTAGFEKTIVVLNIGGVMDMAELKAMQGINAILLMTQLGNIGGLALADVLSGDVTPSGKLTDTWAARYEDYPSSATFSHNNGNVDDDNYTEGIYVGYRYFDTAGVKPIYHFGYGKSYTTFEVKPDEVIVDDQTVTVKALVKNTGSTYSGKEVVQVYVSAPAGDLDKPAKELKAFVKTDLLAPGSEQLVSASFALQDMASYSEAKAAWVLEKGDYVVLIGCCSACVKPAAVLRLGEEKITEQDRNILPHDNEYEEMKLAACQADAKDVPVIGIAAAAIATKTVKYTVRELMTTDKTEKLTLNDVAEGRCTLEELIAQLTVEEMATLCVGTQRASGEGDVVGNASDSVPGAAGETSPVIWESRGIPGTVNADGPAGLRLQSHYRVDKEGKLLPGGQIFGDSVAPFPEMEEGTYIDGYQYATAIPIGWALAQSWNMDLVEQAGDVGGKEMEIFNVDMWLAPALNIHRNPLCGRNFEYYSEDPVVSGEVAAAITKGVQKHPGKGTTIKHYALNNQEDNRYFTNAHVSERAAREIYLKGFEICVKKSQPIALMTSYNLINGIHAADCYDTIQCALRDEWGYQGVVMTDWFTSQEMPFLSGGYKPIYPIAASAGCVWAGNDIQEPGCQENVDDIIRSVKEDTEVNGFKCTLADLQYNARNVIRAAIRCRFPEMKL